MDRIPDNVVQFHPPVERMDNMGQPAGTDDPTLLPGSSTSPADPTSPVAVSEANSQGTTNATIPGGKNPWVLKHLKQIHKDAISLSLTGKLSREQVAEYCGKTPAWVTLILKQPLAREYIKELEDFLDLRLRGLYEKSVAAIDAGLSSPKVSDKLAAATLQLRTIGKLDPADSGAAQTAEDVVAAMLIQGDNVQVNFNRK